MNVNVFFVVIMNIKLFKNEINQSVFIIPKTLFLSLTLEILKLSTQ